jgi:WD40 repeat protein
LTGYLGTTSFFADLYHGGVCLRGTVRGTLEGHLSSFCTVVFSPDGQLVALGSSYNTVWLWDARTGAARGTLKGHSSSVWTVVFSPDGQLVASGSDDKTVRPWDTRTGTVRGTLKGHSSSAVVLPLGPSDILNTRCTGKQRLHNQCLSRSGLSNSRISVPYCQIKASMLERRMRNSQILLKSY